MRRIVTVLIVLAVIGLTMESALAGDRRRRQSQRGRRDNQMKVRVYQQSGPYVWVPQAYVGPNVPRIVRPTPIYRGYSYGYPRYQYYQPRRVNYYYAPRRPWGCYYPSSGFSISWSW